MQEVTHLIQKIQEGDFKSIAQGITIVENELPLHHALLTQIEILSKAKVIGITGPPGAGKSTLVNALLHHYIKEQKKIAVLSIDPSSPFNFGALLGDRIRMSDFYLNPNVYIRSLASRGSLGGLSTKIIEIVDVLKSAPFDIIFIETVGVGQSEVDIAALADTTIVTVVPEAGDEVQTMKAGVMEIADIFVVNKSDRSTADSFVKNLKLLSHQASKNWQIPVIKSVATKNIGITELAEAIDKHNEQLQLNFRKNILLTNKAYLLLQQKMMKSVNKEKFERDIHHALTGKSFNLYAYVDKYFQVIKS